MATSNLAEFTPKQITISQSKINESSIKMKKKTTTQAL